MVRFIKVVRGIDQITDCIPIVSTVKNVGILLYQRIHKINKIANPDTLSWKDDIKIHMLSKDDFMARIYMIPIMGNFTAIFYYLNNAVIRAQTRGSWIGGFSRALRGVPLGYLGEAIRTFSWGLKRHNIEVVKLYLARNPDRSEEKLKNALKFAASLDKLEIFKLILDSRTDWSSNSIQEVLKLAESVEVANLVLERYSSDLTGQQVGSILEFQLGSFKSDKQLELIELLLKTYQNIDMDKVGLSLKTAVMSNNYNISKLLIDYYPKIGEKYHAAALRIASNRGYISIVKLILQNSPYLATLPLEYVIKNAITNKEFLEELLTQYEKDITTSHISKLFEDLVHSIHHRENDKELIFLKELISKYPNLPAKDLETAMEEAALLNAEIFELYLDKFNQLQPENLQNILNKATFIYVPQPKVIQLIQKKFPHMQAIDSLENIK